jgi:hypothetical protein
MAGMWQAVTLLENRPEPYDKARAAQTSWRKMSVGPFSVFVSNWADRSRLVDLYIGDHEYVAVGVRGWRPSWVEFPQWSSWYVWEDWPRWGE